MKAAVVIEKWKLPIFERHLKTAGFVWVEEQGLTNDTLTLKVEYESVANLKPVILAAQIEARKMKLQ